MNTRSLDAFFRGIESAPSWSSCWIWGGRPTRDGYGNFGRGGRGAHRRAYELAIGPIPHGLVVDHRCETRLCVNPLHLKATTQRHNILRSAKTMPNVNAAKTHCPKKHEYTPENTYEYRTKKGGRRRDCHTCRRDRVAARSAA